MDQQTLETALIELVGAPNYHPAKPKTLVKRLHLPQDRFRDVKRTVKQLVRQGKLAYGSNHLVTPAKTSAATAKTPGGGSSSSASAQHVTGSYRRAAGGFGFVRPANLPPGADRDHDIYIARDAALDAADGDIVMVRLSKKRGFRGLRQGEVVEVIERETHQFVGTYLQREGTGYVQIDGKVFAQPISVGDPGVKNARTDDKVVVEMVRFPSHLNDGEGVIVEVLGARGEPGVDTLSIIREYGLPDEFPVDVLDAARGEADQFSEEVSEGRTDFTAKTTVTIDPVDARDFDDAISLVRLENGHWQLSVHIADVSHFVRVGTPLDREARHRATSVYLPDRVLPMLPEVISNSLASLQPDHVRYTKTAVIEFTADGAYVATDLHSGAIRSDHRFTYEDVDDFLADREPWKQKLAKDVHRLLGDMHELAMILRSRRMKDGALELSLGEVKIDLDTDGRVCGAHVVEQTESHQIVEEFMLAANEAVARRLEKAEYEFLRRVHGAPDPRKLKALTEFVRELKIDVENLQNRFEVQALLAKIENRPEQHAVNFAVLRSLQRAVYSPMVEGHYALAKESYCHFTSPIRRYPDLTVHRLIDTLLVDGSPELHGAELVALGEHCSERERRAEAAERDLTKVKLLEYMSQRIGEEMDAIVTGVERFGMFAQGVDLPAEGMIHISALTDDYYSFDRTAHSLIGRRAGNTFRLGDRIRVVVASVDVDRRELDMRVVRRSDRPQDSAKSAAGKRKQQSPTRTSKTDTTKRKATKKPRPKTAAKQTTGKKKPHTKAKAKVKKTAGKKRAQTRKAKKAAKKTGGKPAKKQTKKSPRAAGKKKSQRR